MLLLDFDRPLVALGSLLRLFIEPVDGAQVVLASSELVRVIDLLKVVTRFVVAIFGLIPAHSGHICISKVKIEVAKQQWIVSSLFLLKLNSVDETIHSLVILLSRSQSVCHLKLQVWNPPMLGVIVV